jgi:hypothetical protein
MSDESKKTTPDPRSNRARPLFSTPLEIDAAADPKRVAEVDLTVLSD